MRWIFGKERRKKSHTTCTNGILEEAKAEKGR